MPAAYLWVPLSRVCAPPRAPLTASGRSLTCGGNPFVDSPPPLSDLSQHFATTPEALRGMLECKGRVRELPAGTTCGGGCTRPVELGHYGRQGYVAFEGPALNAVAQGEWRVLASARPPPLRSGNAAWSAPGALVTEP
jgi:hypothetical protein